MHMADALVSVPVAATMAVASAGAAVYAVKKVKQENDPKKIPLMGVMGAFVFAAQMINFTIPGTGSSGHMTGSVLLSAVLGPEAGFISMIAVLLIQCLLFADGGLMALGCNVWNMAFYGCLLIYPLVFRALTKNKVTKGRIIGASMLSCVLGLQLGAFSVTLQTLASGITELPFSYFVMAMQPIHLAIGLVEGLVTAAVLCFLHEMRPDLLEAGAENRARMSGKAVVGVIAAAAAVIGGGLSYLASSLPDGLEWSMEQVAGTAELTGGAAAQAAGSLVERFAIMPDYSGGGLSGIVGGVVVCLLLLAACAVFRLFHGRKNES